MRNNLRTCFFVYVKELLRARYVHGHERARNFSTPVNFDINSELFQFLSSFLSTSSVHTQKSRNISEVHGSSYFYGVGKSLPCRMLLSLSKMKICLKHLYQVIHCYMCVLDWRSLGLSTYANPHELSCIITVFQTFCNT